MIIAHRPKDIAVNATTELAADTGLRYRRHRHQSDARYPITCDLHVVALQGAVDQAGQVGLGLMGIGQGGHGGKVSPDD